jgi:hypothetical protein
MHWESMMHWESRIHWESMMHWESRMHWEFGKYDALEGRMHRESIGCIGDLAQCRFVYTIVPGTSLHSSPTEMFIVHSTT